MSGKTPAWSLLRPGAEGWELWKFRPGGQPVCQPAPTRAAVAAAPRLAVALPTREVTTVPLWLPNGGNFRELAELEFGSRHLLRRGMDVQCVPIAQSENRSLVLALASGAIEDPEGYFPKAVRFEANARTWLPLGADVILWKESGALCFALYRDNQCVFFSAGGSPGPALFGFIQRTLLRLRAEGVLDRDPQLARLFGPFSPEERNQCAAGIALPLEHTESPPFPHLPTPAADLPPPAIRELRATRKRRARLAGIGLVALAAYGALVLLAGADLSLREWRARSLREEAAAIAPEAAAAREDILRWRQIRHAVDPTTFALDLLAAVAAQLPGDQVRLTTFALEPGRLALTGEARDVAQAYQFIEKVKAAPALTEFDWNASQPELAGKQNVRFTMEGTQPDAQTLPQ